jgi:hypothetical protein
MDFFGRPEAEPERESKPASRPAAAPPEGLPARRKRRARSNADPDAGAGASGGGGTGSETAATPAASVEDAVAGGALRLPPAPPAPSPASFAAQATNPDLADFVAALGDEQFGYLAVAVARALRQRLGGGGSRRRRGAGPDALARAARLIAAELAASGADGGDTE